ANQMSADEMPYDGADTGADGNVGQNQHRYGKEEPRMRGDVIKEGDRDAAERESVHDAKNQQRQPRDHCQDQRESPGTLTQFWMDQPQVLHEDGARAAVGERKRQMRFARVDGHRRCSLDKSGNISPMLGSSPMRIWQPCRGMGYPCAT